MLQFAQRAMHKPGVWPEKGLLAEACERAREKIHVSCYWALSCICCEYI